ncbi:OmpA family protein [bacterium]|nr:OmpA family protein [bacterium]
MTLRMKLMIAALALLPLAACNTKDALEAGGSVDEGNFGNPTMMNQLAMMNEGDATQMLGHRFASDVDTTVNFEFNSSQLSADAMATLSRQASWIKRFPEVKFSVYGYTDRVGTEAYNKGLGLRRAKAVVAYLIGQGISGSRLQALVSYGETRPVVDTQAPEVRNRRAVTGVSGFARGYTGLLNGKYAAIIMREYIDSATRVHPVNTNVKSAISSGG